MSECTFKIVKAGWLYRLSDVLKIWKREWAVIYVSGDMTFMKSQSKLSPDKKINLRLECKDMLSHDECKAKIPENQTKSCIFGFSNSESSYWFCAESEDEALVWTLAIEQLIIHSPPPYSARPYRTVSTPSLAGIPQYGSHNGYYYQAPYPVNPVIHGTHGQGVLPQTVIQHPDGTQTVYVNQGGVPYCYDHGCAMAHCHGHHCDDAALGLMAGVTAGALLCSPLMWGPFF